MDLHEISLEAPYWINVAQDGGNGRLLLILRYTADFHTIRGISRLTEVLSACQVGVCFTK